MSVGFVSFPVLYVGLLGLLGATALLVFRVTALSQELEGFRHKIAMLDNSEHQMRRRFIALSKLASHLNTQLDELWNQVGQIRPNNPNGHGSVDETSVENGYGQAIRLLALGLDSQDVADRCGFSRAEVELVELLRNTVKRLGG